MCIRDRVKTPSAYELPYGTKGSGKHGLGLWGQRVTLATPSCLALHSPCAQVLSRAQALPWGRGAEGRQSPEEWKRENGTLALVISPFRSVLFVEDVLLRVLAITSSSIPESILR